MGDIGKPDAVVLSYAALLIQFYPSPSRLLSLIDPLLMFGILLRCLNAYQDPNYLNTCPRHSQTVSQDCHHCLRPGSLSMKMFSSPANSMMLVSMSGWKLFRECLTDSWLLVKCPPSVSLVLITSPR